MIREGLGDRVSRLPPITSTAFRDQADAPSWEPAVKYILAEGIANMEREDFKKTRAQSQSSSATPPPTPIPKEDRPPKPVNTFLMFCREFRRQIMDANPNINAKDASRILGENWQKLTDEQKARYFSAVISVFCIM